MHILFIILIGFVVGLVARWIGPGSHIHGFWITVAIGVALVVASYVERRTVPPWVPRVAIATIALGVSTLVALQPGIAPSIVSSAFSLVAIVLLVSVIVGMVRRPR